MINVIITPTCQNALLYPIIIPNDMGFSDSSIIKMPAEVSDHSATQVSIPFTYEIQPCYKRNIRLYSKANYEMLNNKILNYYWTILYNGSVNYLQKIFTELAKQCIPWKTVCIRPDDQPWYDSAIRRLSRKRHRIINIAKYSCKSTNWQKYKNLRNTVNNKKNTRKKYFSEI